MKKVLLMVMSLALLFMVGCGSKESETHVLRMGIVTSGNHTHNKAIKEWAGKVKEETEGRLEIRLLESGQLGGERDYIEGMQLGNIDMAQVSSAVISNFSPDFNIMSLPYIFTSYESIENITEGEIGAKLFTELEAMNITGLTWFSNGFRSVFTNKEVITPTDLNGVKIRVMESPVMINTLNAMGASATPMAYSELYTAIQQGVLDGGENAPGNILNDKFYEVSNNLSLTEHFATPGVVAISTASLKKLPEDLQDYLKKSTMELGRLEREMDKSAQKVAVEQLKEKGMTVNTVDKDLFIDQATAIYEASLKDVSPEMIELLQKELDIKF